MEIPMRAPTAPTLLLLLLAAVSCERPKSEVPSPVPVASAVPTPEPSAEVAAPTEQYVTLPEAEREKPPPAGVAPDWHFPQVVSKTLTNGLSVDLAQRSSLPLVEIQLVLLSGTATDGSQPGVSVLAGEMLKVGGSAGRPSQKVLDEIESLGATLHVLTSRDSTTLSLAVTSDRLNEALNLLSQVVLRPNFDATEFRKLRQRELDRVRSQALGNPGWAVNMVLYRELYAVPGGHPYAHVDALPSELERRTLWQAKQWYKQHFTPKNARLVLAGDVTAERAEEVAKQYFGSWQGGNAPRLVGKVPEAKKALEVYLVDRPSSPQAEVALAFLGPERKSADWPAVKVANQVLGGGVSGRLFLDVREQQSLAYSTYSSVGEVAHGPGPLVLKAGTQTAKAGLALKALFDHATRLASNPPSEAEQQVATRYLADVFLLQMETVESLASMTARLDVMGLKPGYYDEYRAALRDVSAEQAEQAFARYAKPNTGLAVVAGDAQRLQEPLSHFGPVVVLDPANDFKVVRKLEHNPEAPIELPRIDGT